MISIFGLNGAKSIAPNSQVQLNDNSGGCQHQNLFTASSNSTESGYGSWDPISGALEIFVAKALIQVLKASSFVFYTADQALIQQNTYTFSFTLVNPLRVQVSALSISHEYVGQHVFNIDTLQKIILFENKKTIMRLLTTSLLQSTPQVSIYASKSDTDQILPTRLTCPVETTQVMLCCIL